MKKAVIVWVAAVLLSLAGSAYGASQNITMELNANTSDVEGKVEGRILRYQADLVGAAGMIYSKDDYWVSNINLSLRDRMVIPELTLGLGFKGALGRAEFDHRDYDAYALGFMCVGEYDFREGYYQWPVSISGAATFAPSVMSFGDTDRYIDCHLTVYGHVHENAAVLVGYRLVDMRFETRIERAKKADGAFFFGIRLDF